MPKPLQPSTYTPRTNQGRIDTVIELANHIFLFKFKLNGSAAEALAQIKSHACAQKYRLKQKPLTLVGANFDSSQRQVSDWQTEEEQDLAGGE